MYRLNEFYNSLLILFGETLVGNSVPLPVAKSVVTEITPVSVPYIQTLCSNRGTTLFGFQFADGITLM